MSEAFTSDTACDDIACFNRLPHIKSQCATVGANDLKSDYHTVKVVIDEHGEIQWTFTCTAPEGARCRLTCPEGCEQFNYDAHEHPFVDYGECVHKEWFDNAGAEATYEGGGFTLCEWVIDGGWDGDSWTWTQKALRIHG